MMQPSLAWNSIADLNNLRMNLCLSIHFSLVASEKKYIYKKKEKKRKNEYIHELMSVECE